MLGAEDEGPLSLPSQDMLVMGQPGIGGGGEGAGKERMVKGGWLDSLGSPLVTSDRSRPWRWLGYGHDGLLRLHGGRDASSGMPSHASSPSSAQTTSMSETEHAPTTPLMFPRQGGLKGLVRSLYSSSDSSASDSFPKPTSFDEPDTGGKTGGESMRESRDENVRERRKRQVEQDRARFERGDSVMDVMGRDVAEVFGRKVVDEEDEDEEGD